MTDAKVRATRAALIREREGGTKRCAKCGARMPYSDFPRNANTWDQASSWCRECHNEAVRRCKAKKRAA